MKRILILVAVMTSCLLMSACGDVKWFKSNEDDNLIAVNNSNLKEDTYYVKQGTKFFKVFNSEIGSAKYQTNYSTGNRVIPLCNNTHLIPSHYLGELVAYSSTAKILSEVSLERFRVLGYSFGIWGGTFDKNGYFNFKKSRDIVEDSSLGKALEKATSDDIRIVSIDGVFVSENSVNTQAGVITGLEEGKTYTVQLYVGTYFNEIELTADTFMLQSYELFFYDSKNIEFTSNGYMCFNTPDDLKSGYYSINGAGLFKYYNHNRGKNDTVDMNISYYETEREKMEAYSRQYTIDINTKVKDITIQVEYSSGYEMNNEDIRGCVYSPSGIQYDMNINTDKHMITLNLTEAEIGEWTINIAPKTLEIIDVSVDSTKLDEEATLKQQDFIFDEEATNIVFRAETKGPDKVHGYIVAPDGRTYDMTYDYDKNENTGVISYEMAFLSKGTYQVKIYYHPTTTDLSEITMINNMEVETDIIYVH